MQKSTVSYIVYETSDTIIIQGKRRDVQKYINKGYYVKEERNGYWVLVRAARLNVTINDTFSERAINMKADVCDYYGKPRISESLVNKFKEDIRNGNVAVYMDLQGNYSLR